MKNIFLRLLLAGAIFTIGCNADNNQSTETTEIRDTVIENRSAADTTGRVIKEQLVTTPPDRETQATAELCACVNSFLADMSPQVRRIIIKSSNSSTPLQTLTTELQQVKGAAEQEQLLREFEKFENNPQLQRCSEGIKQKYNLDENDQVSTEKVLKAAEQNKDCEVVYALMKIGLEQEKNARAIRK